MTVVPSARLRRADRRDRLTDREIRWSPANGGDLEEGLLLDRSRSGFGVLMPADLAPPHGAAIRVEIPGEDAPMVGRVVRVAPQGRLLAVVGCRRLRTVTRKASALRAGRGARIVGAAR